jgi:hypothetical protein
MATQAYYDGEPFIVKSHRVAAVAAAQEKYGVILDLDIVEEALLAMMREWDSSRQEDFHPTKSRILDRLLPPCEFRSPYSSVIVRYFKSFPKKQRERTPKRSEVQPVTHEDWERVEDTSEWSVWVCERTREIHLFHNPTISHSESNYTTSETGIKFLPGSVTVEGQTCTSKELRKQHQEKGEGITYLITKR